MLTTLTVDGYRSFRHYEVEGLTAVNLFVGTNNCGKTSLLEAVQFLASKGSISALLRSSESRGEASPTSGHHAPMRSWVTNVTHLFHGHDLHPESEPTIRIEGKPGNRPLTVTVRPLTSEESNGDGSLFDAGDDDDLPLALEIAGSHLRPNTVMAIGRDGSLLSRRRLGSEVPTIRDQPTPTRFLAPRSLSAAAMRDMWDRVQIEGRETEVLEAIRLVAPEVESIYFLVGDRTRSPHRLTLPSAAGILARLRDQNRRVPLGSLGDGLRRVLALSLSIIEAADGFLLADELDSGLHWTVMQDLWRFIIEASRRSSVQVFATTHSLDCIHGLASLSRESPELASDVSVFKLDRRLETAIRFDADNVEAAVAMDIELR